MQADQFPFVRTFKTIFRDIDGLGHVNNAVYITHMETLRTDFFAEVGNYPSLDSFPFILAEITCRYRSPAFFGEVLTAGMGVARLGNRSFHTVTVFDGPDRRRVAEGTAVLVTYDYAAGRTMPIPEDFRAAVAALQGDWSFTLER